jgi:hypothetical protein
MEVQLVAMTVPKMEVQLAKPVMLDFISVTTRHVTKTTAPAPMDKQLRVLNAHLTMLLFAALVRLGSNSMAPNVLRLHARVPMALLLKERHAIPVGPSVQAAILGSVWEMIRHAMRISAHATTVRQRKVLSVPQTTQLCAFRAVQGTD